MVEGNVEKIQSDGKNGKWMVLGRVFEIDARYEIIDPIGKGAYGIVVAARDTEAEDP
jgi:hypothetical protein